MKQPIRRTFHCPDLDSQAAVMLVEGALANTPGVMDFEVSLDRRDVVVVMRDPEGEVMVRRNLEGAGFPPED